nr:hypothetical protein [Secundilactobacillus silagei]
MTIEADTIILAIGQETNAKNLGIKLEHGEAPSAGYKTHDPKSSLRVTLPKAIKPLFTPFKKGKKSLVRSIVF